MNELTTSVLTALLLASFSVMADSNYPAADFQPKVLFSDSSAASSAAPAAQQEKADPNFPAANFQPKVVYNDSEYKHSASAPVSSAPKSATESASAEVASAPSEPEASSNNNLLGLIALAVVGFFLYKKNTGCAKSAAGSASSATVDTSSQGATGVERYLEKQGINKTGVAKYLDKQEQNPSTGVSKYMAKQLIKDREAAAANATGVEKYLRKNG